MKPYYTDPYTVTFEANIIEAVQKDDKFFVFLDKSYFYPTSGGQEHDTGFINGAAVIDVFEQDGKVVHQISSDISEGAARCEIDWKRRFENMQQHTGQHILSAAFENFYGIQTVSSRLGEQTGTIDLSREPLDSELERVIAEANKIVQENRPVRIHFADPDNISAFKLRKPPKVEGTVRIVEVEGFDFSACGGTHCTHGSEVGVILTGNMEKVKGSLTRIEFFCGGRAIRHYRELHGSGREAARLLSTSADQLPASIEKLKDQLKENESAAKVLSQRVLEYAFNELRTQIANSNEPFVIFDLSTSVMNAEELRYLASKMAKEEEKAFAFYRSEGTVCQMNIHFSRHDGTAPEAVDELRKDFGGKGGGRDGFYSFVFDASKLKSIIEALRKRAGHA